MGRALIRWKPPLPKQEFCPDGKSVYCFADHEHESWLDLFLDLTIVALLINLSGAIYNCGNTTTVVFGCFRVVFIFFNTRLLVVDLLIRFFAVDFVSKGLHFCVALGFFYMASFTHTLPYGGSASSSSYASSSSLSSISPYSYLRVLAEAEASGSECEIDTNYYDQFAMGYFVARGAVFFMYTICVYTNYKARVQFSYTMAVQALSMFIILIGVIIHSSGGGDAQSLDYLYLVTCLLELIFRVLQPTLSRYIFTPGTVYVFYPLDISELQHRLAHFVMIVVGESFIALITTSPIGAKTSRVIIFLTCSLLLVFSFSLTFYDAVHRNVEDKSVTHVMTRSKLGGAIWQVMHFIVGFTLFIVGSGLKECFVKVVQNKPISRDMSQLLSAGCGSTVVFCAFLRALHRGIVGKKIKVKKEISSTFKRTILYGFHLLIGAAHFAVGAYSQERLNKDSDDGVDSIIVSHMALSLFLNMTEIVAVNIIYILKGGEKSSDANILTVQIEDDPEKSSRKSKKVQVSGGKGSFSEHTGNQHSNTSNGSNDDIDHGHGHGHGHEFVLAAEDKTRVANTHRGQGSDAEFDDADGEVARSSQSSPIHAGRDGDDV